MSNQHKVRCPECSKFADRTPKGGYVCMNLLCDHGALTREEVLAQT